mmetsp:Transcript_22812/g.61161  ORF Transcript_22812/g.61161 Transcript_22812/m.61161 type:complete len:149 (+) Transcript_22812:1493-1939(+)
MPARAPRAGVRICRESKGCLVIVREGEELDCAESFVEAWACAGWHPDILRRCWRERVARKVASRAPGPGGVPTHVITAALAERWTPRRWPTWFEWMCISCVCVLVYKSGRYASDKMLNRRGGCWVADDARWAGMWTPPPLPFDPALAL